MEKIIRKVSIYKGGGKLLKDDYHLLIFLKDVFGNMKSGETIIFVFSAFAGITRLLDECIFPSAVGNNKDALNNYLEEFKRVHLESITALFGDNGKMKHVRNIFMKEYTSFVSYIIQRRPLNEYDKARVSGFGEVCSMKIMNELILHLSGYTSVNHLDARAIIKTTGNSSSAQIVKEISSEKFLKFFEMGVNYSPISTIHGYIGSDYETGKDTNMGYDSSDSTAGFLASVIGNEYPELEILVDFKKDIRGVYRDHSNPILGVFPAMTRNTYLEFANLKMGEVPVARDAIEFVPEGTKNVKFRISSYLDLTEPGTIITF